MSILITISFLIILALVLLTIYVGIVMGRGKPKTKLEEGEFIIRFVDFDRTKGEVYFLARRPDGEYEYYAVSEKDCRFPPDYIFIFGDNPYEKMVEVKNGEIHLKSRCH